MEIYLCKVIMKQTKNLFLKLNSNYDINYYENIFM
jgi:hypothetical protein